MPACGQASEAPPAAARATSHDMRQPLNESGATTMRTLDAAPRPAKALLLDGGLGPALPFLLGLNAQVELFAEPVLQERAGVKNDRLVGAVVPLEDHQPPPARAKGG